MYQTITQTQTVAQQEVKVQHAWLRYPVGSVVQREVNLGDGDCKTLIAADNSGSTSGFCLTKIRELCTAIANVHHNTYVALWNNEVEAPKRLLQVNWKSEGGTCPSRIFKDSGIVTQLAHKDCFVLITDGQIDTNEIRKCAEGCFPIQHLPCIFIIVDYDSWCVANVSVVSPIFHKVRDAVCLRYKRISPQLTSFVLTVECGKGAWGALQPGDEVSIATVLGLPCKVSIYTPQTELSSGILLTEMSGTPMLDLSELLNDPDPDKCPELEAMLINVPNLAALCRDAGKSKQLRTFCRRVTTALNAQVQDATPNTDDLDAKIAQTIQRINAHQPWEQQCHPPTLNRRHQHHCISMSPTERKSHHILQIFATLKAMII